MKELIVGIILAAVAVLALVAYRHPDSYKVLSNKLSFFSLAIFLGICTYFGMTINAESAVLSHMLETMPDTRLGFMKDKIENLRISVITIFYTLLVLIGFNGYMYFLKKLPILGITERNNS